MFENFTNNSLKSHYLSAQGLSWDAMFKMPKLELIPHLDMFIFFEKVQEVEFLMFLINIAKPTINV